MATGTVPLQAVGQWRSWGRAVRSLQHSENLPLVRPHARKGRVDDERRALEVGWGACALLFDPHKANHRGPRAGRDRLGACGRRPATLPHAPPFGDRGRGGLAFLFCWHVWHQRAREGL